MQNISTSAPEALFTTPTDLRAARVAGRITASPAVAALIAGLVYPAEPRDHAGLLASITASRTLEVAHAR